MKCTSERGEKWRDKVTSPHTPIAVHLKQVLFDVGSDPWFEDRWKTLQIWRYIQEAFHIGQVTFLKDDVPKARALLVEWVKLLRKGTPHEWFMYQLKLRRYYYHHLKPILYRKGINVEWKVISTPLSNGFA